METHARTLLGWSICGTDLFKVLLFSISGRIHPSTCFVRSWYLNGLFTGQISTRELARSPESFARRESKGSSSLGEALGCRKGENGKTCPIYPQEPAVQIQVRITSRAPIEGNLISLCTPRWSRRITSDYSVNSFGDSPAYDGFSPETKFPRQCWSACKKNKSWVCHAVHSRLIFFGSGVCFRMFI